MKPYQNIKLTAGPDLHDIRVEGRNSRAGNLPGRGGDIRAGINPRSKASSRRTLKRRDRAAAHRDILMDIVSSEMQRSEGYDGE